jgi:hypothetical protein
MDAGMGEALEEELTSIRVTAAVTTGTILFPKRRRFMLSSYDAWILGVAPASFYFDSFWNRLKAEMLPNHPKMAVSLTPPPKWNLISQAFPLVLNLLICRGVTQIDTWKQKLCF